MIWRVLLGLLVVSSLHSGLIHANGRQPCDRGAGGISHCQGDRFVCNNGTISRSTKICNPTQFSPPVTRRAGPAQSGALSCGSKRRCGEMDSCAEARHYLTKCGVRSLDRDGDGVPCESLCGGR